MTYMATPSMHILDGEKIKRFKSNIDVLTLSATPIPRTLQMSMTGIRSLALIGCTLSLIALKKS